MTTNQSIPPRGHQVAPQTKLARLLRNTLDAARRDGLDHRITLSGGAQVIMRVRAAGQVALTIKRPRVEVGAVELRTFQRDAGVPETAERRPPVGQYQRDDWYYVTFLWKEMTP